MIVSYKKSLNIYLCLITLCFFNVVNHNSCFSQQKKIDSLLFLLKNAKHDTDKINFQKKISFEYSYIGANNLAISYADSALKLSQKLSHKNGIATSLSILGSIYLTKGDYSNALECYLSALKTDEQSNDSMGIAMRLNRIGMVFQSMGDYSKSREYFQKALSIGEQLNDFIGVSDRLTNIGNSYAVEAINISDSTQKAALFSEALSHYFKSLKLQELMKLNKNKPTTLGNIGNIYMFTEQYNTALEYYQKALNVDEALGNKNGIARHLNNISSLYFRLNKFDEAEKHLLKAIEISKETGTMDYLRKFQETISRIYEKKKQYKLALDYYKNAMEIKDSLFNDEKRKEITQNEMNYTFEKKEAATKAEQDKKDALVLLEQKKKNIIISAVSIVLILLIVFSFFTYGRYKITQKQKIIIETQKSLVDEKQKEIIDSINYAKRIQNAILVKEEDVIRVFPDSFLFYKPKDIVAGDFYFFEYTKSYCFYAAADCTGHGVPGSLISIVCSNALSRCIKEFNLHDPGEILTCARTLVLETFAKSGDEIKDGMDISLLCFKYNSSNDLQEVKWSGANNPLWVIRTGKLMEYKGDKQPIGKSSKYFPFTTHSINIQKNDTIYLFTDGLQDQFGGEKEKKYKTSRLKNLLVNVYDKSMQEQKDIIESSFYDWKKNIEQVDDICVIGLRI
jgi:tetratricopeptide (TPR) repeat protein